MQIHAPSMYNITAMKNRKLKFGLAVGGVVVGGCAIPWVSAGSAKQCLFVGIYSFMSGSK